VLRVAFGKLYVGSSPTIGIFLYVAQGDVQCLLGGLHPPQCTGAHELRSCA